MEYLVGFGVAVLICAFGVATGFDRDRSWYPTITFVVASYYILFAAMAGSAQVLIAESLVASAFVAVAVAGFRKNLWFAAAALAGHGIFDSVHHLFIENAGVPVWWPGFCLGFDVPAGVFLGLLLKDKVIWVGDRGLRS